LATARTLGPSKRSRKTAVGARDAAYLIARHVAPTARVREGRLLAGPWYDIVDIDSYNQANDLFEREGR
jgi:hypothetical protein